MGRHSAPAEDEDEAVALALATPDADETPGRVGRHSRGADPDAPAPGRTPRPMPRSEPDPDAGESNGHDPAQAATSRIPVITDPAVDAPLHSSVTQRIPVVTDTDVATDPAVVERPPPTGSPVDHQSRAVAVARHAAHDTAADLHLVRSHPGVLIGCVLAVLIPLAAHVVVLFLLDDFTVRRFLVWIWAPLVLAGILLGIVLDLGHRRYVAKTTTGSIPRSP